MKNQLSKKESEDLLALLENRFENNKQRHHDISWIDVQTKLEKSPDKLWSLHQMEITDGEPDVIGIDNKTNQLIARQRLRNAVVYAMTRPLGNLERKINPKIMLWMSPKKWESKL